MRYPKYIFSIVLFFYCFSIVHSQQDLFNKIFADHKESSAYGIVENDNFYYIGGTLRDSIDFADKIFIKRIPKVPLSYETKIWSIPNCHFCSYGRRTFIKTSDNGFAMIGYISGYGYDTHGFLMKFNSNCDTLWMKHFYDTVSNINERFLRFFNFIETYDKGFIVVGQINASGVHNNDIVLIKTDSFGNTKWFKTYGHTNTYDVGWSVAQTPDSGYLIGGYTKNYSILYSNDAYVIKIDKHGIVIWEEYLGGQREDGIAYVNIANDSNYLVAYSYAYKQETPGYASKELSVIKMRPNKQIIWGKNYRIHRNSYVTSIFEADNHEIIVSGKSYYYDQINHNSGDKAYIIRLTENGDSIWCRNYFYLPDAFGDSWSDIYDIKPSLEGGLLACGRYQHHDLGIDRSAWILKTDSNGSYTIGIDEYDTSLVNMEVCVFPNPASETISVQLKRTPINTLYFELFDIHGKIVRKLSINSLYQKIPVIDLQNGVYLYRLRSNKNNLANDKLVIMK